MPDGSIQSASATIFDWSVAVFARNERASIGDCLRAIELAARGRTTVVTVMLNGSTDGSAVDILAFARNTSVAVRLFEIPYAGKSNAWNQFIHIVRPPARTYFFVDAYAEVEPESLLALERRLASAPHALAAAAVPTCGRSAAGTRANMQNNPALHGSLFALRDSFVDRIGDLGIWLPADLYRGDGLIGAIAMHDCDAQANAWLKTRIVVATDATWRVRPLSLYKWSDIRRRWNRLVRQAQGRMEDATLQRCIYRDGFARLPELASVAIEADLAAQPTTRPTWRRNPLGALALRRLRRAQPPSLTELGPRGVRLDAGPVTVG